MLIETKPALLNGWLPLFIFYISFGIFLFFSPRNVVKRLYDRSGWTFRDRFISAIAKLFAFPLLAIIIISPIQINTLLFLPGVIIYCIGFIGFFSALSTYSLTPQNTIVTTGIYRYSRNPQIVSIFVVYVGIACLIAIPEYFIFLIPLALQAQHRIILEEKSMINVCEDEYLRYMEEVPRYFSFLGE